MGTFWNAFLYVFWIFAFVAFVMILFTVLVDLFRDSGLNGWWKALWVIFFIFFPLISALVYVIVRGRGMAERTMKRTSEQMAAQEDYIRTVAAPKSSSIEELTQAKALLDAGAISPGA